VKIWADTERCCGSGMRVLTAPKVTMMCAEKNQDQIYTLPTVQVTSTASPPPGTDSGRAERGSQTCGVASTRGARSDDAMAAFAGQHGRCWRAERDLEDFFNLSPDLLCISGFDGYFRRVNPAVERTLGYTAEELLSIPWWNLIHPDDRARTREGVDDLARGQEVFQLEMRGICRDGSLMLFASASETTGLRGRSGAGFQAGWSARSSRGTGWLHDAG